MNKQDLKNAIQAAFDDNSDKKVNPAAARADQAQRIADAIELYVLSRTVTVAGVTPGSGAVTGTIT